MDSSLYLLESYLFLFVNYLFRSSTRIIWFGHQPSFAFPPLYAIFLDYLWRLLKIPGYQECHTFFKLIKYVFLSTATFNQQLLMLNNKDDKRFKNRGYSLFFLKLQLCKLYNNKYMFTLTQIANIEIFAFISVLVFNLLSHKSLFINKKHKRNCWKVGYFFKKIANFMGKLLQNDK